jgi:hypothetical protein
MKIILDLIIGINAKSNIIFYHNFVINAKFLSKLDNFLYFSQLIY